MNLYYFGADRTWEALQNSECKRRNEFILSELVQSNHFKYVYVIRQTYRRKLFKNLWKNRDVGIHTVNDIFITPVFPEVFNLSAIRWINRKLNWFLVRIQAKRASSPQDLIWCYWPSGFNAAMKVGLKGRLIFDADHNIIGDINRKDDIGSLLKKEVALKSSLIISGSRTMNSWFEAIGGLPQEKIFFLRNGIDPLIYESMQIVPSVQLSKDKEKPVITYIGVLSNWIEYDLLYQLAERNQGWHFQIIGPKYQLDSNQILKNFEELKNIYFLGRKQPGEVREILKTTDVGLVLYKNLPWLDGDSMKIYDYLAAGVPIVSTKYHDHLEEDFDCLLYLTNGIQDFERKIKSALWLRENELKEWKERAKKFLAKNTWEHRIAEIMSKI